MSYTDEERNVAIGVLAGIGVGVLVGAAAALLLAPQTGEQTRDDLSNSINELSDKVTELGKTVRYKAGGVVERTRSQMTQKLVETNDGGEILP